MNTLHLQRTSIYNSNELEQCIDIIRANDALVLLDDGCYCLTHQSLEQLKIRIPTVSIYVIKEQADARAVKTSNTWVKAISLKQLVGLTFEYNSAITWQ